MTKRRREANIDGVLRRLLPKGVVWQITGDADDDDMEESFAVAITSWPLAEHPNMALVLSATTICLKTALGCDVACGSNRITLTFAKEETAMGRCSRAVCLLSSLVGLAISVVGLSLLGYGTGWVLYRSLVARPL